jgi:hypothetical protein
LITSGEERACKELIVRRKHACTIIGIDAGELISGSQIFHVKMSIGDMKCTYSWYLITEIADKNRT